MAKFLNKKEQVIDFKLTPYGKYLLSIGTFKPTYYALFDDNILYDGEYAGLNENQNTAHERIKDGTPYLESLVLFENVELPGNYTEEGEPFFQVAATRAHRQGGSETDAARLASAEASYTNLATQISDPGATDQFKILRQNQAMMFGAMFQKGSFATVLDLPRKDSLKFTSMIGDAYLDGETQAAPAWKIVALQGEIEESTQKDMDNDLEIPQLNIELNYAKKVAPYSVEINPTSLRQINDQVGNFLDNEVIEFVADNALIYADEVNTELLIENFEIDVFEIVEEFPGAVASSSIMYNYCDDTNLTITANNQLVINDGLNTATFIFSDTANGGSNPYYVLLADPLIVMQKLQSAINNSIVDVSASLGPLVPCEDFTGATPCSDGSSCYSSLIVSKTQVGRIGGPSARAFGGKSTTIKTNEQAGITLANALTEPTAPADVTIFLRAVALNKSITLVDAAGTSKTYTAKTAEDTANNQFKQACPTPSFADSSCRSTSKLEAQARSLKACVEATEGHNGTITVKIEKDREPVGKRIKMVFAQTTPGPDGNTTITQTLDVDAEPGRTTSGCTTGASPGGPCPIPSAFTGGGPGDKLTILRGGMDKRVTFLRKYFEKEESQVINGFLQTATPIVNSPQSYTTSSVEYYFDILVDSEIQQEIACKSAEAFNKQSYYIDLDFDCDEIEQDFTYADIYGRVTDPEICQT